jgi:ferritin-like metal-binding protein YciE
MPELNVRDAKLVQYLNEAHAKEKELETALNAHIGMTDRMPYKKRLRQHLTETKDHARQLERRIKKLGGSTAKVPELASKGVALAKGPLHMIRGTSAEEKLLKNAKTEYSEEHHEIATYKAIEALAEEVGDKETAKLARSIRRDEERMAKYLEGLIPTLTKAVAKTEIPREERSQNGGKRRSSSSSSRKSGGSSKSSSKRGSSSKGSSSSSRKRSSNSSSRKRSSSSSSSTRSRSGSSSSRSRGRSGSSSRSSGRSRS